MSASSSISDLMSLLSHPDYIEFTKEGSTFFPSGWNASRNLRGRLPEGFERLQIPGLFEKSIRCVVGNASLMEAEVIILGDNHHHNSWMRAEIRRFYEQHRRPSDVLLVELSAESIERVSQCSCAYFNTQVAHYRLQGWDDKTLHGQSIEMIREDDTVYTSRERMLQELNDTRDQADLSSGAARDALLEKCALLEHSIDEANLQMRETIPSFHSLAVEGRNAFLVEAVRKCERNGERAFVLTGSGHVNDALMDKLKGMKVVYIDFDPETTEDIALEGRKEASPYHACPTPVEDYFNEYKHWIQIYLPGGGTLELPLMRIEGEGEKVRLKRDKSYDKFPELAGIDLDQEFAVATPPYHFHGFNEDFYSLLME